MGNQITNICPYFDMKNDLKIHVGYPSTRNVYHHTDQPLPILPVTRLPIGINDPIGLPSFEAFQFPMRGFIVEHLAEELLVEPGKLVKYNNLKLDYKFSPGEWILITRE